MATCERNFSTKQKHAFALKTTIYVVGDDDDGDYCYYYYCSELTHKRAHILELCCEQHKVTLFISSKSFEHQLNTKVSGICSICLWIAIKQHRAFSVFSIQRTDEIRQIAVAL